MGRDSWEQNRKCNQLSPQQADEMFFGGRGSKPTKARNFCGNCPVMRECVTLASELDLDGFWAGTTKDERRGMATFHEELSVGLERLLGTEKKVEETKKKTKRRPPQKRKVFTDTYEFLTSVEPPSTDLGLA
jgi:hypothetical protein